MGFTYAGANGQARFTSLDATSGNLTVSLAAEQIASISLAYERFKTDIYESLLLQTRLKNYYGSIVVATLNGVPIFSFEEVEQLFSQAIQADPQRGVVDLIEFMSDFGEVKLNKLGWNATEFLAGQINAAPDLGELSEELSSWTVLLAAPTAHNLTGTSRPDLLVGTASEDTIRTGDGNDIIFAKNGDDIVDGGAGNDVITGQGSFEGGTGDDVLIGVEFSADTYLFNRGDGKDTIWDWGVNGYTGHGWEGRDDVLRFGEGIEASAVQVLRSGYDMVFKVSDSDQVTVKEWFLNAHRYMEQVQFADGTVWTVESLREKVVLSTVGTEADDTIAGSEGKDLINGGPGDDRLQGGAGKDTYLMRRGSGADTISDYDSTAGNTDTLFFDQDVAFDQLWLRRAGSNLEVSIIGTSDKSTIENWYSDAAYRVEQIKTSDGKMLLDSQVDALVSAMAAFAPPAAGQTSLPADYRTTLAPALASSWN